MHRVRAASILVSAALISSCSVDVEEETQRTPGEHGAVAANISARLGEPLPDSTEYQRAIFKQGEAISLRRFKISEGLGPAFNVTFCTSCHEKPTPGGGAGLYRNFFITNDNVVFGSDEQGPLGEEGGVLRMYYFGDQEPARPSLPTDLDPFTQRNPIPFYGSGLLAEIPDDEIRSREDPDDENGDGISGRVNFSGGRVGRFGRKAQTSSLQGFLRGPLFNHLGITTQALTRDFVSLLPTYGSGRSDDAQFGSTASAQVAIVDAKLEDSDGVPDPELHPEELFALLSYTMLLAAPAIEVPTGEAKKGQILFDTVGCDGCHLPRIKGPRGNIPAYSDLLIHDMGENLSDGLRQGRATESEFRTQPLWGIGAVGPYLHDGRAETIEDAIVLHGGEARQSADMFSSLTRTEKDQILEFLMSLGGRDQVTPGLIAPGTRTASVSTYGGPLRPLTSDEDERFLAGRTLFDTDFGYSSGVGAPRFNGDSCRACHFEPVVGGAGPLGVNVMRHGISNSSQEFVAPSVGTILHKQTILNGHANFPQDEANIFEHRQTPHLFGLGLIDGIAADTIVANADPMDENQDGISGRVSWTDNNRVGRFGWKAQVPSVEEFVRDAVAAELGMTLPFKEGLTFGLLQDNDNVADPEMSLEAADLLRDYLLMLAPPPRAQNTNGAQVVEGEQLFESVQCSSCHLPSLVGADGPVPLYSDLLLHETLPPSAPGIEDSAANVREFRTPPLWGLRDTAPYMHSGAAETLEQAILLHDGEASSSREAYESLDASQKQALTRFLDTL